MAQKEIVTGENAPSGSSTRWSRFKDALSKKFSRDAEKLIRKAMAGSNIGLTIDLIGKVPPEMQEEVADWLGKNGRYHNGMIKSIYRNAMKGDGVWTGLFVDAYTKADEEGKNRLWGTLSSDLEHVLGHVEFCDRVDEGLKNAAMLYIEVGKTDEKVNHEKCWDALKNIVHGKSGNSLQTRIFALDVLEASNYGDTDFWEKIITYGKNGDGDKNELAKHAIKLLLKPETKKSEELLLENLDKVAERLVELSYSEDRSLNMKRLMDFFDHVLTKGSDEEKLILMHAFNESKKLHVAMKGRKMEDSLRGLLKSNNEKIVYNAIRLLNRLRWCPESAKNDLFEFLEKRDETKRLTSILLHGRIHRDEAERIFATVFKKMEKQKSILGYTQLYEFVKSLTESEKKKVKELSLLGIGRLAKQNDIYAKSILDGVGSIELVAHVLKNGSDEQKLALLDTINHSAEIMLELKNDAMEGIAVGFLKSGDEKLVAGALKLFYSMGWCPESAKGRLFELLEKSDTTEDVVDVLINGIGKSEAEGVFSAMFRKMRSAPNANRYVRLYMYLQNIIINEETAGLAVHGIRNLYEKNDENAMHIVENMLSNAEQYIGTGISGACAQGIALLDALRFAGKTEEIKKRVSKELKEKTTNMLTAADIDLNINATEMLVALSSLEEAQKLIRKVAVPELKDMVEDEALEKHERQRAAFALARLYAVMKNE